MSFNNQQQKLSPDKHMEEMKSQIKNFAIKTMVWGGCALKPFHVMHTMPYML